MKTILKKKIYIILITIIFAVTGICYTIANVKFVSEHKILIGTSENSNLVNTYKEFVTGSIVLDEVINNLGLSMSIQELSSFVEVETIKNTNMINIKVKGENEEFVNQIANELNQVFINKVKAIYQNDKIYNIDCTTEKSYGISIALAGIGSGIFGCLIATMLFMISCMLDTKVKSCKDIEEITGLKSLISIPRDNSIFKKKLNMKNIIAQKSEVFKTLMTNIQFFNINNLGSKSIFVTSVMPLEGKTYVSNNLAIEFAKAGKKVIMIDSDLKNGKIARIYNLPNNLGFSNYLSNLDSNGNVIHERITKFIHDTEIKNLSIITAGNTPPNPTELLKSEKMKELIKDLKVFYDIIVFDGVPILEAPESQILSKFSDLTFMLSSYGKTKKFELILANQKINSNEDNIVAVGFNNIPDRKIKRRIGLIKNSVKDFLGSLGEKTSFFKESMKNVIEQLQKMIEDGKNRIRKVFSGTKDKWKKIKEHMKNRNEKIKLIEAGSVAYEENNIIKDVFESEMAKLENDSDSGLSENNNFEFVPEPKNVSKMQNQVKSKFDLIMEQKERLEKKDKIEEPKELFRMQEISEIEENEKILEMSEIPEVIEKKDVVEEIKENHLMRYTMKKKNQFFKQREKQRQQKSAQVALGYEELKEKQRMERIRREAEKERVKKNKVDEFELEFQNQGILTEEMIRKQVEMDEMRFLIEKEEEENGLKLQKQKIEEKVEKKRERKEKMNRFKSKKTEQFQNFIHLFKKGNEEKKMHKEIEKQKQREEIRINEEIKEDNLYPRPRI